MGIKTGFEMIGNILKSGKAVGGEMKIAELTQAFAKHPNVVSKQIGELLGGKGQEVVKNLSTIRVTDNFAKELNEFAQMYPEAVLKVGFKQSKQGFTVGRVTVKNGDKVLYDAAGSMAKDAEGITFKTRAKVLGTESRFYFEPTGKMHGVVQDSKTKATVDGTLNDVKMNVGKNGEIATINITDAKSAAKAGEKLSVEADGGLIYADFQKHGVKVSGVADKEKAVELIKQEIAEIKENIKKFITGNVKRNYKTILKKADKELELAKSNVYRNYKELIKAEYMTDVVRSKGALKELDKLSLTDKKNIEKFIKNYC